MHDLLDPCDPRAIQLTELEPLDLTQQRCHDLRPTELHRKLRGGEQSSAPARRASELGGASHGGHRHRDRASSPSSCRRLFELERDVLMLARDQGRPVPGTPVRLVIEHLRERLMTMPTFRQAGALHDCRTDQGMPEADRPQIGVDDPAATAGATASRPTGVPATMRLASRISSSASSSLRAAATG